MQTLTLEEFHAALKAQGVRSTEYCAFKCPVCGTIQSGRSLIAAGAGKTFDDVEKYTAFSCVGRWLGSGPADYKNVSPAEGKVGCDWTLGGLLSLHKLEIITPDGKCHPTFELSTPDEAQSLQKIYDALSGVPA